MSWVIDVLKDDAQLKAEEMTLKFHMDNLRYMNKNACYKTGEPRNGSDEYLGVYFHDEANFHTYINQYPNRRTNRPC